MHYWLMKSEPETFSIDDLQRLKESPWDGVRNYQARNMMRDQMQIGDGVLFYHSNCTPPGIAGLATVSRTAYPDHTALDPESPYYDPKSTPETPRWFMVNVKFVKKFPRVITLAELHAHPELHTMLVLRKGNRLSITPVSEKEWNIITEILESL